STLTRTPDATISIVSRLASRTTRLPGSAACARTHHNPVPTVPSATSALTTTTRLIEQPPTVPPRANESPHPSRALFRDASALPLVTRRRGRPESVQRGRPA